ncbi:Uncharacterised protein [Blautia hydrogenotrophica]|uniref:EpsG family protein n=1 Tax=Blautia hydrogenotrophica TaxID=53443 RepID=UPI0006BF72FF|nr:EpsG family protein [Blautia hydrogenotrophica]CUM97551.1 Uncharacterised protein [Blautia hydrogenotrophica]SCH89765.1 Uncharacterised protein [uncultured Blautia sp.]
MNIYFVNILIVLITSIICKYKIKGPSGRIIEGNTIYSLIVCYTFTFIMALRNISVGVDTAPYARIFTIIVNTNNFIDAIRNAPLTAPVYVIFCKVLSYISKDPQIVIVVSSLIINIGLMKLINKVSVNAPVSYLSWIGLTLFYCSMNGTRQCMALVLSLHTLIMLSENLKGRRAWTLFIIAVLIHPTALVLLFAVGGIILADKIQDNKLLFIISVVASFIIAGGYGIGVRLVLKFIPRYFIYTSGESEYSIFDSTGEGRIVLLYLVLFGITLLWMFRTHTNNSSKRGFIEKMLPAVLFGAIFGILNSKNELINRLLWYYLGIYVLFIPSVLEKYKKYERWMLTVGIVAVLLIYSILSLTENQNGVVPYCFFW